MTRGSRRASTRCFRRERLEQDLDRELAFHIDMLTEQNIRAGHVAGGSSARRPMRNFGAVEG